MSELRAAVLGLEGRAEALLPAIAASEDFTLASVSDADRSRLERLVPSGQAATYDDHRSAISAAGADGVSAFLVALPPIATARYLPLIAAAGLPALVFPPIGVDFETCLHTAKAFRDAKQWLGLAPEWLASDTAPDVGVVMEETGGVHLAVVEAACWHNEPTGWRADSQESGGGVLLHGGIEAIGILVQLLGLPDGVYADTRLQAGGDRGRLHDTEDAAIVHLRYAPGPAATVICRRSQRPGGIRASLFGGAGNIDWVTGVFRAGTGRSVGADSESTRDATMSAMLNRFAGCIRQMPPRNAGLNVYLQTMAVISAAYLSARTGTTESLARMQERLSAHDCLISI